MIGITKTMRNTIISIIRPLPLLLRPAIKWRQGVTAALAAVLQNAPPKLTKTLPRLGQVPSEKVREFDRCTHTKPHVPLPLVLPPLGLFPWPWRRQSRCPPADCQSPTGAEVVVHIKGKRKASVVAGSPFAGFYC